MTGNTPSHGDCQQALEQLHAFLDHELADADTDEIREHLSLCEQCLDAYDLTQTIKDLVRTKCGSAAPADLRVKVLSVIRTTGGAG